MDMPSSRQVLVQGLPPKNIVLQN